MAKNIDTKLNFVETLFANSGDAVLGSDGVFIVPDYQRAYNWKFNVQCDKLWQDIESFRENNRDESYFFGSIILNNDGESLFIIDGQQRITTFMLLLKALYIKINELLRKISSGEDTESIKEALENRRREIVKSLYLVDEDNISLVIKGSKPLRELRIKYDNKSINEEYQDELEKILQGQSRDDIEQVVAKIKYKKKDNKYTSFFRNFKFFLEKLENFDSTEINEFAKALLKRCQLIVVISYQTEEAIEIFNSLNSTGMPLADADILSAMLYRNYGVDKTGFKKGWTEIVKNSNRLDELKIATIDDILNQYMYVLRAKNNEKDTSLPGVRRYFTDVNKESLEVPDVFIADMLKIIDIWQGEDDTKEITILKTILFQHNNNFKFFYATYMYFNADDTPESKRLFVESLLKLFALLSVKEFGYSSAKFKPFLIGLNMDIGAGIATGAIVEKIKEHIKKEFDQQDIYDSLIESNPDNAIVYLNEYLFAQNKGADVNLDLPKIEIEHIMPASGKNIPAIREDADMDEEEFYQYVNKLGNKILLEQPINGAISNDWFKIKKSKSIREKRGYKDSCFSIAKHLISYPKDKWEKIDIEEATKKAAKRISQFIFE